MGRHLFSWLAVAGLMAASMPASAQSNEDRLRDQLRQTTLQLRELQDENAALKAREQTWKTQADAAAQTARHAAPAASAPPAPAADAQALAALNRRLRAETAQRIALADELATARAEAAGLRETAAGGTQTLRTRDAEAVGLRQQIATGDTRARALDADLQRCGQMNEQLVGIGRELLDRYRNKGVAEAMADAEPVIGIARIRLETIAQNLHGRIKDNTLPPASP